MPTDKDIHNEAIDWHIRLQSAGEQDWEEFTVWLESDPRHNAAYENVVDGDLALDESIADLLPIPQADNDQIDHQPANPRKRWIAGGTMLTLVAGFTLFMTEFMAGGADPAIFATAIGETRLVALDDGSSVHLNGESEIVVDGDNPRRIELVRGEARFSVDHDDTAPFVVDIGPHRVTDLGTIFNLRSDQMGLNVEVAEGSVRYEGGGQTVDLVEGDALLVPTDGDLQRTRRTIDAMGSWSQGELVYYDATYADVARDLQRAAGVRINVKPGLSDRRFSGVIQIDNEPKILRERVASLLRVQVNGPDDAWTIEP